MDLSKLRFQTTSFTDTNFFRRPRQLGETPDGVRGHVRGPHSMVTNAIDERGVVVASAAGHVLVHPSKPPILHVVYVWADAPWTGQRLERAVVNGLSQRARANGRCGVQLCDNVRAIFEAPDESTRAR